MLIDMFDKGRCPYPWLMRWLFLDQFGGHHRMEDYARRGHEPKDEVQVYTWPDATLRELTDLVKEVQPAARRSTARLDFALVYPDKKGRNVMRVVRYVCSDLCFSCGVSAVWM